MDWCAPSTLVLCTSHTFCLHFATCAVSIVSLDLRKCGYFKIVLSFGKSRLKVQGAGIRW
ncbi:hypothetical protein O6H91_07G126100 [Diphasiastrum complanatum]|uniref:Uncharacterized protein n=1 Tax=Diphasiastrum complanatum TaxID=34168 RepID=A0ACC2D9R4_DIPCM|nr:hypothetical protein O6H91_07G126100 [Diphasiastrum complanatum]